jgi:hypothetical protein
MMRLPGVSSSASLVGGLLVLAGCGEPGFTPARDEAPEVPQAVPLPTLVTCAAGVAAGSFDCDGPHLAGARGAA